MPTYPPKTPPNKPPDIERFALPPHSKIQVIINMIEAQLKEKKD